MKIINVFKMYIAGLGSLLSYLFGRWDYAVQTLLFLMVVDWISGTIIAALWKSSPKTTNGGLSSAVGFKGITRKCMIMAMIIIANMLDRVSGTTFIRDGVAAAYIANETISLIENMGIMGVPIPNVLKHTIDALKEKDK